MKKILDIMRKFTKLNENIDALDFINEINDEELSKLLNNVNFDDGISEDLYFDILVLIDDLVENKQQYNWIKKSLEKYIK